MKFTWQLAFNVIKIRSLVRQSKHAAERDLSTESVIYKTILVHKTHFREKKSVGKRTVSFTLDTFPPRIICKYLIFDTVITHQHFCVSSYKLKL
jgi:hypothetical protein